MAGKFDGNRLSLELVHRFPNAPVRVGESRYWDILRIWAEIRTALRKAGRSGGFDSIGTDGWGCDFALLDREGTLLQNIVSYRDRTVTAVREEVNALFSPAELYKRVGVGSFTASTACRLHYLAKNQPQVLDAAERLLFLPDYINYLLSGEKACEYTIATTSQFLNPVEKQWEKSVMERLSVPERLMLPICGSGGRLGKIQGPLARELAVGPAEVIMTCGHDSAAAMAAVPARPGERWLCISSGSWSVVGYEAERAYLEEGPHIGRFLHEGRFGGKVRLVCNMIGLWMIQELRRAFSPLDYDRLEEEARRAVPFKTLIVPDHIPSMAVDNLPCAIQEYSKKTHQPVPQTVGEFVRCIYDSMAFNYAVIAREMEQTVGMELPCIYLVGGGVHNDLLSQITADITGKVVVTGPVEAASAGNILVQLIAQGELTNLDEAREVSAASFPKKRFEPSGRQPDLSDACFEKLCETPLLIR